MAYSLNLVETQNAYTDATTLVCDGTVKLNIQVANKAVYYRYMPRQRQHPQQGFYNPEVLLLPNTYFLVRNAERVQVRSAVAGEPALVTIEALTPYD